MSFVANRPALLHNLSSGPLYRSFLHPRIASRFSEIYPAGLYVPTRCSEDVEGAIEKVKAFRPDCLFVAGGDGTVNALLQNGIPEDLPLAVLPLGSANVLAYCLYRTRWPFRNLIPGDAIPKSLRLGLWDRRHFLLMAGIGFDGIASRKVSGSIKSILGSVAYFLAAFSVFFEWNMKKLHWTEGLDENARYRGPSYWVVASRFPTYFPPLALSEERALHENRLVLTVFSGETRSEFLLFLLHRLLRPSSEPWFGYRTTVDGIRLSGPEKGQMDGENFEGDGCVSLTRRAVTMLFSRAVLDEYEECTNTNQDGRLFDTVTNAPDP
jgi:diacylglycerol kinase (ATP)